MKTKIGLILYAIGFILAIVFNLVFVGIVLAIISVFVVFSDNDKPAL